MTDLSNLTVLLLTRALPLHRSGGLEFHSAHLARGLAEAGATVRVITTRDPGDPARREGELEKGVPVHFLHGGAPGGYALGTFRAMARMAQSLTPREGRVVIHAQGFTGFAVRPRLENQRFVVTVHGTLWSETPLWREHWARLDWRGRAAALWRMKHRLPVAPLWRRMLRHADCLIVDSAFTERELRREGGAAIAGKIARVPLGVSEESFPPVDRGVAREYVQTMLADLAPPDAPQESTRPLLLSVGRLHRMKGLHVLLEALAPLRERPWRLLVAGDGPERAALRAQAGRLGLADRVIFLGRAADADLPHLYAAADLFVNPELGQPAFGLVALEALLQGTPVIANRAGALPEVIGEGEDAGAALTAAGGGGMEPGGTLIAEPSPAAWRDALADWLMHERWRAFDPAALRRAALARFSFDRMIAGTLAAYEHAFHSAQERPASPEI